MTVCFHILQHSVLATFANNVSLVKSLLCLVVLHTGLLNKMSTAKYWHGFRNIASALSMESMLQIEGSFVQGIGFFVYEEYTTNSDGLMISNSTWDYKIPSVDIIPKQFNAEVLNTGYHKNRVLSSKGSFFPHCSAG
jgi:hypothetical protein